MAQAAAVTALVFDARPAKAGADEFARAGERVIETEKAVVTATEKVTNAAGNSAAAYARLARQLDPMAAKQQALERGMGVLDRAYQRGTISGEEHARMIGLLQSRYAATEAAAAKMVPATAKVAAGVAGASQSLDAGGKSAGRFGQFVQAAGFQVGDFATQVAGGQSALVAFAQQAPQFLGLFGGIGAIAGAAISIGAVVVQMLRIGDAAEAAGKQAKTFGEVMEGVEDILDDQSTSADELTKKYNDLSDAMKELMKLDLSRAMADAKGVLDRSVADIRAKITEALDAQKGGLLDRARAALRGGAFESQTVETRIKSLLDSGRVAEAIALLATGSKAERQLAESLAATAREYEANKEKLEALAAQLALYNGTATEAQKATLNLAKEVDAAKAANDRFTRAVNAVNAVLAESERYFKPYEDALKRMESAAKGGRDPFETYAETVKALSADLEILTRDGLNPQAWDLYAEAIGRANAELAQNTVIANDNQRVKAAKAQFERDSQELDDFLERQGRAREGIDQLGSGLDRFINDAQNGVFDLADAAGALWRDIDSGKVRFEDLGKALLDSAQAGNALANLVGGLFGRSKEQQKNANKGGAIGGTIGSFVPGGKAIGAFAGNIIGGLFGMSKADERAIKLAAEVVELSKSVNDFVRAASPLTGIAADLAGLDSRFASLRAEAIRLKQPIDEITKSYEAQRRKLMDGFGRGVEDIIDRLTGRQAQADLRALTQTQNQRIADALLAEYDLGRVRQANALELSDFFSNFTADQLAAFGGLVTALVTALDRVKARIRDLTGVLNDQLATQVDLARELSSAARQQAASLRQLAAGLRDQILDNRTGDLSPLSPGQKFSALSGQFDALAASAGTGDVASAEKLGAAGTNLLQAAKAMFATGPEYVAVFDRVQGALASAAMVADVRATALDRIADLSDTQVVILERIQELLATDLGQPTASAIAQAMADGVLTVAEIDQINQGLDDLYGQFTGLPGASAAAVRLAIEAIRPQLVAGTLTDEQKTALTQGQGQIATALNDFRADQIEQYRQALIAAGNAIGALNNFLLDPDGRIPAAVAAAFQGGLFDQTLTTRVQNLFRMALGDQPLPLPLTGQIHDLVGQAVGDPTLSAPLSVQADTMIGTAIGAWTQADLGTRITAQFGTAIGPWSDGAQTLTEQVNGIFAAAIGADGADWEGALKGLLDGQSPLVTGLAALTGLIPQLIAAMASPANDNGQAGQTNYDAQMQAYVTGVQRAAVTASRTISTIPFDDRSGSHNNRTNLMVDTSGATQAAGGSHQNDSSRQRAAQLASGLSALARQVESLSGGTLASFQIQASEERSGYAIGGIDRLSGFGGNDFEAIARNFVADAVRSVQGGNQAALDLLGGIDWSNLTSGFSSAAAQIYQLMNPRRMAAGGLVTGGVAGIDSVPALLMPRERVLSVPQSTMLESIYSAVAGRGRGDAVSDPALLSEMRALRQAHEAMRQELSAYRQEQADRDRKLIRSNEQMAAYSRKSLGQAGARQ